MKKFETINIKTTVEEYINQQDWRVKANANAGYSNASFTSNIAGKVVANYWLNNVYTKKEGEYHRHGDLHIHDLDSLTGYCAGWSLRVLLNEGFNGVEGKVNSRPPSHFNEALGQMANFLGILQSEWAGAQAFSSFDTYLAPYVFFDNLTFKQIKKLLRHFIYNLNIPARWGQSPFTNITLDFSVPKDLQDQIPTKYDHHIFKNKTNKAFLKRVLKRGVKSPEELTYKHFAKEIELIDIAYYEVMTEGDSTEQPFTFPIPTVNITEIFDWNSKASQALFKNTAKRGSSYFQNFLGSQWMTNKKGEKVKNPNAYAPDSVRSMCCRLQLDLRELLKRGNGLFGSAEMTGSIGVVTINMARLGYKFKGNKKELIKNLKILLKVAKSTLEKKRVFIQNLFEKGLFPYTHRYLPNFNNHFSTIGINGANEMIKNFYSGKYDIASEKGEQLAIELLKVIKDQLKVFQKETGNLYNLEATPAEGTTYRFAKEDKKLFGDDIIQAGSGESVYYTNSTQLPVDYTHDAFYALEKQDKLQQEYTGGTVLHLYMNEKITSWKSCKDFVKKALQNFSLPYITITPIFSICENHGYIAGEQEECPTCGQKTQIWTRVMGYHRPVSSFNKGKEGEHKERTYFIKEKIIC